MQSKGAFFFFFFSFPGVNSAFHGGKSAFPCEASHILDPC